MQQYLKPEHENRQILEATLEEFKTVFFIESTLIPSPYQMHFYQHRICRRGRHIVRGSFQIATALLGCRFGFGADLQPLHLFVAITRRRNLF